VERILSLNAVPKKYDEAFKRQAMELVLQGGKTLREVAEDLWVSQYSIYQWKKKFLPLAAAAGSLGKPPGWAGLLEDVEALQKLVREQQRQIADLRQQREILKKRWALSARGPRTLPTD